MTECQTLEFPKNKIIRPPLEATIQERIRNNQNRFMDMVVYEEVQEMLSKFYMAGIDTSDEEFQRQFSLGMEFVRAAVLKTVDLRHPLQPMVDSILKSLRETQEELDKPS